MRFLLAFHTGISVVAMGTILLFGTKAQAVAFLVGTTIALVNILLLYFSWKRILQKKSVALSVGVIVIKYATLGFIIYQMATKNLFLLEWVCVGIGTLLVSALATAVKVNRQEVKAEEELRGSDPNRAKHPLQ